MSIFKRKKQDTPQAAVGAEAETEVVTEAEAEVVTEAETEVVTEAEAEVVTEAEAEVEAEVEAEAEAAVAPPVIAGAAARGVSHLQKTQLSGVVGVTLPPETQKLYALLLPDTPRGEIERDYKRYLNKERK